MNSTLATRKALLHSNARRLRDQSFEVQIYATKAIPKFTSYSSFVAWKGRRNCISNTAVAHRDFSMGKEPEVRIRSNKTRVLLSSVTKTRQVRHGKFRRKTRRQRLMYSICTKRTKSFSKLRSCSTPLQFWLSKINTNTKNNIKKNKKSN